MVIMSLTVLVPEYRVGKNKISGQYVKEDIKLRQVC